MVYIRSRCACEPPEREKDWRYTLGCFPYGSYKLSVDKISEVYKKKEAERGLELKIEISSPLGPKRGWSSPRRRQQGDQGDLSGAHYAVGRERATDWAGWGLGGSSHPLELRC